jgi:hypothetical protein
MFVGLLRVIVVIWTVAFKYKLYIANPKLEIMLQMELATTLAEIRYRTLNYVFLYLCFSILIYSFEQVVEVYINDLEEADINCRCTRNRRSCHML